MEKQQLSHFQFIAILLWSVMGTGILTLPWAIGQFVIRDSWISALMLLFVPVLASGVALLFVRTFPGQSLVEGLMTALGPWFGRAGALWFLIWLFLLNAMVLRELLVYVENSILPYTPINILSGLAVVAMAYVTASKIEVIGRIAAFFTPTAFLITAVLLALAVPHMDFSRLLPVFADGWRPVLRGSVIPWSWAAETLSALQFATALSNKGKFIGRDFLIVGLLMTILGGMAEVVITSVLGEQRINSLFPILEVVRTIQFSEFLERLDPLYVMGTTLLILIKVAVYNYSFCTGMEQVFRLKSYTAVVWGGVLPLWAASLFFWRDSASLAEYILFTVPVYYIGTMFGLPVLAVVVQWIRQHWVHSVGGLSPES